MYVRKVSMFDGTECVGRDNGRSLSIDPQAIAVAECVQFSKIRWLLLWQAT